MTEIDSNIHLMNEINLFIVYIIAEIDNNIKVENIYVLAIYLVVTE